MRVRVVLRTCFCCHQVGKNFATDALTCRGWYLIITKSNLQDGFMMHSAELCTESSQVLMKIRCFYCEKPQTAQCFSQVIWSFFCFQLQPDKTLLIDCKTAKVTVSDGEEETPGRRHHSPRRGCNQRKRSCNQTWSSTQNVWPKKGKIWPAREERDKKYMGSKTFHHSGRKWTKGSSQKKPRVGEVGRKGRQKAGLRRWKGAGWWYF